jgi:hypothetical protein
LADIWFFGKISKVLVRKNFLRLKPNLQNSKISYFKSTSKIFCASANFTIGTHPTIIAKLKFCMFATPSGEQARAVSRFLLPL